jgi:hypothetical protein
MSSTMKPWAPYAVTDKQPWDLRRVVHLHRRAGFAATWNELQRDLKDGPKASVERLLAGKARGPLTPTPLPRGERGRGEGVPEDFTATADALGRAALATSRHCGAAGMAPQ